MRSTILKGSVISLLALLLLCSFLLVLPELYTRWKSEIPDYPQSQHVMRQENSNGPYKTTVINFETNDTPNIIEKFYTDTLQQAGWTIYPAGLPGGSVATSGVLRFSMLVNRASVGLFVNRQNQPIDLYILTITITTVDSQHAKVVIQKERTPTSLQTQPVPHPGLSMQE